MKQARASSTLVGALGRFLFVEQQLLETQILPFRFLLGVTVTSAMVHQGHGVLLVLVNRLLEALGESDVCAALSRARRGMECV